MRSAVALLLAGLGLVAAQKRCDGAVTDVKCADVPDIMALNTTECQDYHFLIARGTDERAPGRMGNVTKLICDQLGGKEYCGWESIDYPAKNRFMSNNTWCESADIGVRNGQRQVRDYASRCPDSKLILMGYSQGGSVTQDIIGGGGGPIFRCTQSPNEGLNRFESPGANIAAVVTFGTVRRRNGETYSFGTGRNFTSEGNRTEAQRQGLEPYAGIIRDYCNTGDPICATNSKGVDLKHHLTYMQDYQQDIIDWTLEKLEEAAAMEGEDMDGETDLEDDFEEADSGESPVREADEDDHAIEGENRLEEIQESHKQETQHGGLPPPKSHTSETPETPQTKIHLPPPMVLQHKPLLHKLQSNYWLTGALFFSLSLSWTALYCYTSQRRKYMRGC